MSIGGNLFIRQPAAYQLPSRISGIVENIESKTMSTFEHYWY